MTAREEAEAEAERLAGEVERLEEAVGEARREARDQVPASLTLASASSLQILVAPAQGVTNNSVFKYYSNSWTE